MDNRRYRELIVDQNSKLTREEWYVGWHFCWEWDDLLVGHGSDEWGDNPVVCRCGHRLPSHDSNTQ